MHTDVVRSALKKLGKEEWLIEIVQELTMCRNAPSRFQANGTFSDDIVVHVVLHQDSVLSPLLFIIALEAVEKLGQNVQKGVQLKVM